MAKLQGLNSFQQIFQQLLAENHTLLHQQYLLHKTGLLWPQVAGKLAEHSAPLKIKNSELLIAVDNAALANQMFMLQSSLLKKINQALQGEYVLMKIGFRACQQLPVYTEAETLQAETEKEFIRSQCPICGASMDARLDKCFNCVRAEQTDAEEKLKKQLIDAPWLEYSQVQSKWLNELVFERIREKLAAFYFEKVRNNDASQHEEMQAILFYTRKKPSEISRSMSEQVLAVLKENVNGKK